MSISNPSRRINLVVVPLLMLVFLGLSYMGRAHKISQWIPQWQWLMILATLMILEQVFRRREAVSQRAMLVRDVISNIVNLFVTGAATGAILYPVLVFFPEHFLGRKMILTAPDQLGPFWLQVIIVLLTVSFVRYWVHRLQHTVAFLWELHSYHHRTTDLQISNKFVSHPIDYAIRNILIYFVLYIVGFNPWAFFIAIPIMEIAGAFDHCGADVRSGPLNYLLVTPEVHRWHHAVDVPDGYGYSCNYGVEFSFWDIMFGTYYLPKKNGVAELPQRIGYPGGGLPDESNYLMLLLAPLGLRKVLDRVMSFSPKATGESRESSSSQ